MNYIKSGTKEGNKNSKISEGNFFLMKLLAPTNGRKRKIVITMGRKVILSVSASTRRNKKEDINKVNVVEEKISELVRIISEIQIDKPKMAALGPNLGPRSNCTG